MAKDRVGPTVSPPDAARGRSTSIDSFTMYEAVTMKMMRRTRVMSTRGVTLMPVMASSLPLPEEAMLVSPVVWR